MYFVTSAAVGTRCILLMNTLSLHRKKVKLQEEMWVRTHLIARKGRARRPFETNKLGIGALFFLDKATLGKTWLSLAPNIAVHMVTFVPMSMAIRQLTKTGTGTSIQDTSALWIDSILLPNLPLSTVLFAVHILNWRFNSVEAVPYKGMSKNAKILPPVFLVFPFLQAIISTQLPAALTIHWTMTALLATSETVILRLPFTKLRKILRIQPQSVYLLPKRCEMKGAFLRGNYSPSSECAKDTIMRSKVVPEEI